MRVALVHDWLTGMRGGEKVLEVFARLFPEAPLFTLVHVRGSVAHVIEDRAVHTSPLSRLPGVARTYRWFLPLFPALIERFELSGFDLVISTSSCVAKGVRTPSGARHVSYVFSPMRYVWDRYDDYFGPGRAGPLVRLGMGFFRERLRRWDARSAARVDVFVASSSFVADRIRRYYGRDAEVIPPPVDVERFRPSGAAPGAEWLVVSALSPYKRVDVAIRAAEIAGVPLVIVGSGPEEKRLRRLAGARVRFTGWVSDEELARLYAGSRGLLFPGTEDFGIAPLEAMASGRPVVAFRAGGALETVRGARWEGDPRGVLSGATGLFVEEQSPEAFARAIGVLEKIPEAITPADCRQRAEEFSKAVFERRIRAAIDRWAGAGIA